MRLYRYDSLSSIPSSHGADAFILYFTGDYAGFDAADRKRWRIVEPS